MAEITEGLYFSDVFKTELDHNLSREEVTILAGSGAARELVLGQVVGKITKGAALAGADSGNTGNGTAGAVTLGAKALVGDYTIQCITTATNGGVFAVYDPDGRRLADLTVGTAYAGEHINLIIADGGTDFAVGDLFTVSVAPGSGKMVPLNPSAVDGSQDAAGIMAGAYSAADGVDGVGVAVVRDASFALSNLTWPVGITTGQKTAALAQLAALGLIARKEA